MYSPYSFRRHKTWEAVYLCCPIVEEVYNEQSRFWLCFFAGQPWDPGFNTERCPVRVRNNTHGIGNTTGTGVHFRNGPPPSERQDLSPCLPEGSYGWPWEL